MSLQFARMGDPAERYRRTPETATLFYSADREELAMYDCTSERPESR